MPSGSKVGVTFIEIPISRCFSGSSSMALSFVSILYRTSSVTVGFPPEVAAVLVVVKMGIRSMMEMVDCSLSSVINVGFETWLANPPSARARSTPLSCTGLSTRFGLVASLKGGVATSLITPVRLVFNPKIEPRSRASAMGRPSLPRLACQFTPVRFAAVLLMRRIFVSTMICPLALSIP